MRNIRPTSARQVISTAIARVVQQKDGQGLPEVEPEVANHVTPSIKGQAKPRPPAAAENEPQSLLFVTSVDVLWVEVLEDQLLRQEQLQLVAAMARAIRGKSVRCEHQQFDWPPSGQGALAVADNGMAEVLSGFLQRLTRDHSTELMVLMGDCDRLPRLASRKPASIQLEHVARLLLKKPPGRHSSRFT